jgi:Fe2+ transport system protein FeoA|tara:strand:- start:357 stop:584 length:228 start_codon:yes stop_codon:yes gene_type:complete
MPIKTLPSLSPGESAVIKTFNADLNLQSRLVEMGILPGIEIRLIKKAPFKGPIAFKIRGYEVSLRYGDAEQILLQ